MRKVFLPLSIFVVAVISVLAAAPAQAQATRTWVSGVGDDANPCSRTAPCKTFAGAISKTARNGEINVIDPGGFGAVTITKSITIIAEGFEAGCWRRPPTASSSMPGRTTSSCFAAWTSTAAGQRGLARQRHPLPRRRALHVQVCLIRNFPARPKRLRHPFRAERRIRALRKRHDDIAQRHRERPAREWKFSPPRRRRQGHARQRAGGEQRDGCAPIAPTTPRARSTYHGGQRGCSQQLQRHRG